MMYQVSDEGRATVAWDLVDGHTDRTVQQVQDSLANYLQNVNDDLAKAGITLLSDSYRVRTDIKTKRPLTVFWSAQVPPEQVDQLRAYLGILAASLAGA